LGVGTRAMTCNDDECGFLIGNDRFGWTDFQRVKYLRRFLRDGNRRLELLKRDPLGNTEQIEHEKARIAATKGELERLERMSLSS